MLVYVVMYHNARSYFSQWRQRVHDIGIGLTFYELFQVVRAAWPAKRFRCIIKPGNRQSCETI